MKISLKSDWKKRVSKKTKMYSLNAKNRKLMNKIFDDLHRIDRMFWTNQSTSFFYSCFCVWKSVDDEKKNRVIVDIRNLNVITQFDAYSLSLQTNIIIAMRDCDYISIIDCSIFFYQWRIYFNDRHKLTVVNHKKQKNFNVTVMNYKNSSTYVQRQIDRLLREYRHFVKTYVNDIVVFFRTKIEHETHLRKVFSMLDKNNISIKSIKIFLSYSSISLLDQKIDSLNLITSEEKLKTIVKFRFSRIFRQFETYLDLTNWLRDYISHYVDISKFLQNRKIELLRDESTIENVRRVYSSKTRVQHSTAKKTVSFDALRTILTKSFYLVHSNSKRQLFINLNANKKFEFDVMFYYVKKVYFDQLEFDKYSLRHVIKSILFFSRLFIDVETRYWFIELKIIDIIWMLKKTRYIVEISSDKTIVYIDHEFALDIVNQITMTTISIDKLNLRLVRASDYIQRFNLDIRHKSDKQHIVFDVLSRLVSDNINASMTRNFDESELDALFTISLIEMKKDFRNRIFDDYKIDLNWQKISQILNADVENVAKLSFCKKKMIWFFVQMILLLMIIFTSLVVFASFISLYQTFCDWFMTMNMRITSNTSKRCSLHIIFAICLAICVIIWNIVRNVKCIKSKNTHRMIRYNSY